MSPHLAQGQVNGCLFSGYDTAAPGQFLHQIPMASSEGWNRTATNDEGDAIIGRSMIIKATGRLQRF
jgi:hypothetical protein